MQSRLEEEEEEKAALMSRIQRLTKLILVSSKKSIPAYLGEAVGHQRSHSDYVSLHYRSVFRLLTCLFLILKRHFTILSSAVTFCFLSTLGHFYSLATLSLQLLVLRNKEDIGSCAVLNIVKLFIQFCYAWAIFS